MIECHCPSHILAVKPGIKRILKLMRRGNISTATQTSRSMPSKCSTVMLSPKCTVIEKIAYAHNRIFNVENCVHLAKQNCHSRHLSSRALPPGMSGLPGISCSPIRAFAACGIVSLQSHLKEFLDILTSTSGIVICVVAAAAVVGFAFLVAFVIPPLQA